MTEQKRARVVCNGAKEWVSAGVFRSINDQTKALRRCTSGGESQYTDVKRRNKSSSSVQHATALAKEKFRPRFKTLRGL